MWPLEKANYINIFLFEKIIYSGGFGGRALVPCQLYAPPLSKYRRSAADYVQ